MLTRYLIAIAILLSACAPATQISAPGTPAAIPDKVGIQFSFRPMAFDGQYLWQIVREPGKFHLSAQDLHGQVIKEVPLTNQALPVHRSLAWGENSFWMLDQHNTLFKLSSDGKQTSEIKLPELTAPGGLEQLVWSGKQLWVLHRSYLEADGSIVPTRFYQIDPSGGKVLSRLEVKDPAFNFAHTNLAAGPDAFYVARGHIFEEKSNLLYKIQRADAAVTTTPLGRIHTGMTSLFRYQDALIAVEMLDVDNCGEFCRGQLLKLPTGPSGSKSATQVSPSVSPAAASPAPNLPPAQAR
ncbi:MAG: hypothetical protein ACAI44_28270 [Candidatus Sericytochromatia bacterium]